MSKTLEEVIELTELCMKEKYEGKLRMQSDPRIREKAVTIICSLAESGSRKRLLQCVFWALVRRFYHCSLGKKFNLDVDCSAWMDWARVNNYCYLKKMNLILRL